MNSFKVAICTMAIFTGSIGAYAAIADSTMAKPAAPAAEVKQEEAKSFTPRTSYLIRKEAKNFRYKIPHTGTSPVMQITPEEFPKLYEKLGADVAKDSWGGSWAALYRTVTAGSCDKIALASVSEKSTPEALSFYVRCENGHTFTYNDYELKDDNGQWFTEETAVAAGEFVHYTKPFKLPAKAE